MARKEGALLQATSSRREGKTEWLRWNFAHPHTRGKWLSCDYAQGLIRLNLAIGEQAKHCLAKLTHSGKPVKLAVEFVCE